MANEPADRLEPADLDGLVERLLNYRTGGMRGAKPSICQSAATTIRSMQARCAELEATIEQAAKWFDEYAAEHYAKAKTAPDYREQGAREDKGKRNKDRAHHLREELRRALTKEPE